MVVFLYRIDTKIFCSITILRVGFFYMLDFVVMLIGTHLPETLRNFMAKVGFNLKACIFQL